MIKRRARAFLEFRQSTPGRQLPIAAVWLPLDAQTFGLFTLSFDFGKIPHLTGHLAHLLS